MISKAVHRMSTHNVFYVTRDTGWACILGSPIQGKSVVDSAKGTVTVAVDADVVVGAQQQHQPICCGFCHHDANQQERRNIGEESEVVTLTSGGCRGLSALKRGRQTCKQTLHSCWLS